MTHAAVVWLIYLRDFCTLYILVTSWVTYTCTSTGCFSQEPFCTGQAGRLHVRGQIISLVVGVWRRSQLQANIWLVQLNTNICPKTIRGKGMIFAVFLAKWKIMAHWQFWNCSHCASHYNTSLFQPNALLSNLPKSVFVIISPTCFAIQPELNTRTYATMKPRKHSRPL